MIEPLRQISGVDIAQFMRDDWHIRPRLFRQAFPAFEPLCDLETIAEMASDPDIESRLIKHGKQGWQLEHGPFVKLPSLTTKGWTVLVQGIDHHLPEAYDLLQQFRFVPDARLDDVMLSLASDTGGVGPHYDSYDVFLLQMHGARRWRIGPLENATLKADCPLKILEHFSPTEEYLLEPGDMLYLPPNYGHDGVAEGVCSTLSIGFRAPTKAEMLASTLRDLADQIEQSPDMCNTLFSDPARGHTTAPAELPDDMLDFAHQLLQQFKPQPAQILRSVGVQLTEPKPHVYFENNTEDMQLQEIVHALGARGIALSMKSKMLYKQSVFFINGEQIEPKHPETCKLLQLLANHREMASTQAIAALQNSEFQYFVIGFAKAGWVETLT
ncbi:MAG TPA: cupin domain-containing protein [Limnobacter sp.]|nr:cupin domain-containing protein [Limnobacter sp.]